MGPPEQAFLDWIRIFKFRESFNEDEIKLIANIFNCKKGYDIAFLIDIFHNRYPDPLDFYRERERLMKNAT